MGESAGGGEHDVRKCDAFKGSFSTKSTVGFTTDDTVRQNTRSGAQRSEL